MTAPDFKEQQKTINRGLPFRIRNYSWWEQELPSQGEMQEGLNNLEAVDYEVDYVITHCASNRIQKDLTENNMFFSHYEENRLTDYFEQLENRLTFRHWFFGHYHNDEKIDEKHTVLYETVIPIED